MHMHFYITMLILHTFCIVRTSLHLSILTSQSHWETIEGPFKVTYARHTRVPTHSTGASARHGPRSSARTQASPAAALPANCEDRCGGKIILCCDDFRLCMRLRHSRRPGVSHTDRPRSEPATRPRHRSGTGSHSPEGTALCHTVHYLPDARWRK